MDDYGANVVLTADTSQYNQAVNQSAQNTDAFGKSVDGLGHKLESLSKRAGRTFLGIAAADTATIVAATAAYGAFEKQMTSLNAQAAILEKSMGAQKTVMRGYAEDVNSLRRTFGATTNDAAQLVQTISKMKDNTTSVQNLEKSFSRLGHAVSESPTQLSQGMLQLQKTMGTTQRDTDKYNNQLTVLQARSNATASSILDFSNAIAPVGRLLNMSQTDIMGFSNAFIKAGQDGQTASTVVTRMITDIAAATQSGSPQLAKYANLVGMTTSQFKELGGTNQILSVLDSINRAGPRAITTLNRMGYDGMRSVRAITAMSQQSGGIASEIDAARNADPNAMQRGSDQAMSGMVDALKRLRAELNQTAESFGANFAPAATKFIDTMSKMMDVVRRVVDSPLGKLAAMFAAVAAPIAAIAGTGLVAAKALMTITAARAALTGAAARGFKETGALSDAEVMALNSRGLIPGVGPGREPVGPEGRTIADPNGNRSWTNRLAYNAGSDFRRVLGRSPGSALGKVAGYGMSGVGFFERNFLIPQFQASSVGIPGVEGTGGYNDIGRRARLFNASTFAGSMGATPEGFWGRQLMGFRQGYMGGGFMGGNVPGMNESLARAQHIDEAMKKSAGSGASDAKRQADAEKFADRMSRASTESEKMGRAAMTAQRGLGSMAGATSRLVAVMGSSVLGTAKMGVGAIGKGLGAIGLNPYMLAIMGGMAGYQELKKAQEKDSYHFTDFSSGLQPYYQAGGFSAPGGANYSYGSAADMTKTTLSSAYTVTSNETTAASDPSHKLKNTSLKGMSADKAEAFLGTQWATLGQNPQAVQAVSLDLIDKFGAPKAQQILNNLKTGKIAGIDVFATSAAAQSRSFILNRGGGAGTSKDLNEFFGALSMQTDQLATTKGLDSAMATRGQTLDKALSGLFSGNGRMGKNKDQIDAAIAKNLFGIDHIDRGKAWWDPLGGFGTEDRSGADGGLGTGAPKDLKSYLQRSFTKGYVYGPGTDERSDALKQLGITETKDMSDKQVATAVYNALIHPPKTDDEKRATESAAGQIKAATKELFGAGGILGIASVKRALESPEDLNAQYQAVNAVSNKVRRQGGNVGQQINYLANLNASASGDASLGADIFNAAIGRIQQTAAYRAPYQTRTTNFKQATQIFSGGMTANLGPEGEAQRQQYAQQYAQQVQDQYNYFKQMLYQQREFNVSRGRAEYDFNLQRQYAQSDFARQRARAEQDYQIQRQRAEADFARQMGRNRKDFNLQRRREDADHNHQVMLMIEQQAKAMYNMYDRVKVQRTDSATWLLRNSQDQTQRMQQQEANLGKLRGMGLSDDAIQQMGLTDSANAQQLARFVSEVAGNPDLVKKFNKEVSDRLKAAAKLVKDDSSTEWEEFQRSYKLSRNRAQDDFEKSVKRAREDFKRNLSQQDDDFAKSLKRQNQDFGISMNRSEDAFRLSMNRSAADLARSAETIDGNFENILEKAVKNLGGHAGKMAKTVLGEFRTLKGTAGAESADIMQVIADIFGVDYTPPKGALKAANVVSNKDGTFHVKGTKNIFQASGGVLPGFTPGVDVHHFSSPDGQQLHLSGGEAVMVPEWTKKVGGPGAVAEMNRRARSGYAKGGVYWPVPGHETGTYPGHDGVDINRGSGWDDYGDPIRAFRAGKISYVGTGHGYGDAIFEQGPGYGTVVYGHTSKTYVHPGQMVAAGQLIGRVGNTGHATAPHLHFGQPGGTTAGALALLAGALPGGFGNFTDAGLGMMMQSWNSVKKKYYPQSEAAAAMLSAVHPLQHGMISAIMNRFGKKAYNNYKDKYGASFAEAAGGSPVTGGGTNIDATGGNQAIVKKYMQQFGWNQWPSLYQLVMHESGFRNTAQNPTSSAYGMFQFLDGTWPTVGGHKTSDPNLQSLYGMRYIKNRYHDPNGAWNHWQGNHSYGNGAIFGQGMHTINVGERGPEAVIPLNDKGTDFMAGLLQRFMPGTEAKQGNVRYSTPAASTHNEYHYRIDRSTTFSGAIQVMANNPNEFLAQLQAKQRVAALSQPSLGGMR